MSVDTQWRTPLLRAVSRSFYLSLRFLPEPVREPLSLGYLLARLSDTIADAGRLPVDRRKELLGDFMPWLAGEATSYDLNEVAEAGVSAGENELCLRFAELRHWFGSLPEWDRGEVRAVLSHITEGQRLDLERFGDSGGATRCIRSAAELERYTWLVAGSVGEFWTRLCTRKVPGYCDSEPEAVVELIQAGARFGRGLQLINILRDFPKDIRQGRCYLPGDELISSGLTLESVRDDPALARDAATKWLDEAEQLLGEGLVYAGRLRSARMRFSVFAPTLIGLETLRRVRQSFGREGIKVNRKEVRVLLLRAATRAVFGKRTS